MRYPGYEEAMRQEANNIEKWLATPEEQIVIQASDTERRWAAEWGSAMPWPAPADEHAPAPADEHAPLMSEPKRSRLMCDCDNSQRSIVEGDMPGLSPSDDFLWMPPADLDQGFDMHPEEEVPPADLDQGFDMHPGDEVPPANVDQGFEMPPENEVERGMNVEGVSQEDGSVTRWLADL